MNAIATTRRNRQTGTTVHLVDNRDGSFDVGGQPWITYCEDHGNYCEHETRALAQWYRGAPSEWCFDCEIERVARALARDCD